MQQPSGSDKSIGDIIKQNNNLSAEEVDRIIAYQQDNGVKFGEAAVALGLAKREDVLWALSQQFHYPYAQESKTKLNGELIVASNPFSMEAEIFRDVRSQLLDGVFGTDSIRPALAVISPEVGDGKSFFAANLAVAFSQLGGRTLLVDADMRTPRQHEIFGIDSARGLSSILSGRAEANVIRPVEDLPSLFLLPVGTTPPNPVELIQRPAFGLLLAELCKKFDHVIVDTPAASHGSDARVIASMCGTALVVARQNANRLNAIKTLIDDVTRSKGKIAGITINQS